ncbi:hypothetical protein [Brachybacterium fresconis]|uniref:Membrane protein YqjE n=1 Tax=Brachybacterium fresconis TaxID=173363 RepID=A0ABS4YPK0_9MICO|nr:hypothetical protein [Brachybacterium fresconis]MBP2410725.1 putative membrane protein YqjE [Brachybacterium fresconis]
MATMPPDRSSHDHRGRKPSVGRPALFVVLLAIASLGVLGLLVVGPSITLPVAVAVAAGLLGLVGVAWAVAGPRL